MPQDDESLIKVGDTPEEIAAEEAAFNAAFAEGRGEELPEPETPEEQPKADEAPADTPKDDAAVAGDDKPAADPVEPETPAPAPRLIAGLTEEQVAAALARTGNLQTTVDKMAGRIGQLMQQLDALKTNPPTTQQAQKALDIKLEKLTAAFPELAAILKEDLAGLSGTAAAAPVAEAPPPGLTQAQLDAILAERLSASANQTKEMIETRVLSVIHPDWNQIIRDPSFALFRDNVLPPGEGKALMESEDAAFIAGKLSEYKAWKAGQAKPAETPAAKPAPAPARRLANAVLPATTRAAPAGPVTEEDAFAAGFAQERAKRGG